MSNAKRPLLIKLSDQAFDSKIRSDKNRRKVKFITDRKMYQETEVKHRRPQTRGQCMSLEERADQASETRYGGDSRKNK